MRRTAFLFFLASLVAFTVASPTFNPSVINNEYIVQLHAPVSLTPTTDEDQLDDAFRGHIDSVLNDIFGSSFTSNDDRLIHKYTRGFAAKLSQDQLTRLLLHPAVDYIEPNQVMSISGFQKNPRNWGLDRISHRDLPLAKNYIFPDTAGSYVTAYVVDTGVNIRHQDFGGRAIWGFTAPRGDEDADGNGHGTHVASTIAGKSFGVAKNATIVAVKVLRSSGYGTTADVIRGIEWTATDHKRRVRESQGKGGRKVKSVANMSLGGGKSRAIDTAVERAIRAGVLFAVAAGNDNRDACDYSPAGAPSAITVGASTRFDMRSSFSNWGQCVDIFAPGSDITAAWIGSTSATRTISGTSMASPHVCGVMALLMGEKNYESPEALKEALLHLASTGKVQNRGRGSPNLLLFDGAENPDPETSEVSHEI